MSHAHSSRPDVLLVDGFEPQPKVKAEQRRLSARKRSRLQEAAMIAALRTRKVERDRKNRNGTHQEANTKAYRKARDIGRRARANVV